MSEIVATELIVPGRGLERAGDAFVLSAEGVARADAAAGYVHNHLADFVSRGRQKMGCAVVFAGGYSPYNGVGKPTWHEREAFQMEKQSGLRELVPTFTVPETTSTMQDVYGASRVKRLREVRFTPERPLGLVGQEDHQDRMMYFAAKAFRIGRKAMLPIIAPAVNEDGPAIGISEAMAMHITRVAYWGARSYSHMRAREVVLAGAFRALDFVRSKG